MDCQETQKAIPRFIKDELEGRELQAFLNHVESCEECKEELSIQYLVTEGMNHLEKDSTFDLQGSLEAKLSGLGKKSRVRERAITVMYVLETIAILAVIAMTVLVITK